MKRQSDLTKSQLFLDDTWVEDQQRLTRLWHKADIFPEPVLRPEKPWEGTEVLLGSAFRFGDVLRMYYIARSRFGSFLCVAESEDGFQWERPMVGEYELCGSKENNIVFFYPFRSPSICYEPDDPDAPLKLFYHGRADEHGSGGLRAAVSKDGYC